MTATTTADHVRNVLDRLEGVKPDGKGWHAKCPAHEDRMPSLSIGIGDNGSVLLRCHAGCAVESITAKLGITVRDLFAPKANGNGHNGHARRIIAEYDYRGPEGEVRYQAVRYQPKDFKQRRPDGKGAWIWNLESVERVLYRLPELNEADTEQWVFIVEGEKDVDRLISLGLVATCNVGGAGKWRDEYSEVLRARRVVLIPDNDNSGRNHTEKVAQSLDGIAAEVRIVPLPGVPEKGDVTDYLNAGGTAESLLELVDNPPVEANGESPITLATLWRRDPNLREPVIDGLIRRGQVGNIISTSKSYKTYLILSLAIAMATKRFWLERFPTVGGRVLVIDLELQPGDITRRTHDIMEAMHADPEIVGSTIDVMSFRGRAGTIDQIEKLLLGLERGAYSLVIVDPLYKTYPPDFDENSNAQMTALYRRWERIAEHLDAGLFIVHHGTKGSQSEKRIVDVGAGASAQSRSADSHIALREHEADNCVVFDSRVRSFPPIEPMVLRWEYPQWHRDLGLNPEDLKTGRKSRNKETADPTPTEEIEAWTPERFVATFITADAIGKHIITAKARNTGMSGRQADDLLRLAEHAKQVYRWTFPKNRTVFYASVEQPITAMNGGVK